MRKINFRAWDNIKKKMYQSIDIITPDNGRCVLNPDGSVQTTSSCVRYNIMQFTGLKDAKGHDIYEGDIVKAIDNKGRETTGIIEMGKWSWGIVYYVGEKIRYTRAKSYTEMQVIGNIYENPELI